MLETLPPDAVVLHPLEYEKPSLASHLAGLQTVITVMRSFAGDAVGTVEMSERVRDARDFFTPRGPSNPVDRTAILGKYRVNYVCAPLSYAGMLDREPVLGRIFANEGYVLYRVTGKDRGAGAPS